MAITASDDSSGVQLSCELQKRVPLFFVIFFSLFCLSVIREQSTTGGNAHVTVKIDSVSPGAEKRSNRCTSIASPGRALGGAFLAPSAGTRPPANFHEMVVQAHSRWLVRYIDDKARGPSRSRPGP